MIGLLRIVIDAPESRSLKEKRAIVRSVKGRIESRFKVSVVEVGNLDALQQAELAIACASNDGRHADEMLAHIADFVIANPGDGIVSHLQTEILHIG